MEIPKRFKLLGRIIEVNENARLMQDRNWTGAADYAKDVIEILPINDTYQASRAKIEQTFCHELCHHLLYHAGGSINYDLKSGDYIHKNEEFVDLLGSLLHQALTTMEYENDNTDNPNS